MAETARLLATGVQERRPVLRQMAFAWRLVRRWPVIPGMVLSILVLAGIFAPLIAPHDFRSGGVRSRHIPPAWTAKGTMDHILGTDHAGRDVFSRILYGARISLVVAAIALTTGFIGGTALGLVSGYAGGWVDEAITRFVDIWLALPFLMVALVAVIIFGQSLVLLLVLMASLAWVNFVRVVRSQTLQLRSAPYVDLARVAGASHFRIILRHIMPGVINTAVVIATLTVGNLILAEAALSFLGAGVPPPTPAWGLMVAEGRGYIGTSWWPTVFPGLCIFLVVLSLNFFGDWLRDHFDPRLRQVN
jgi:peptide/nickel transport system permease protein